MCSMITADPSVDFFISVQLLSNSIAVKQITLGLCEHKSELKPACAHYSIQHEINYGIQLYRKTLGSFSTLVNRHLWHLMLLTDGARGLGLPSNSKLVGAWPARRSWPVGDSCNWNVTGYSLRKTSKVFCFRKYLTPLAEGNPPIWLESTQQCSPMDQVVPRCGW